jgi:hypothetical protein
MSADPSVFPFWHIALTAALAAGVTLLVVLAARQRLAVRSIGEVIAVAVVVGFSVLAWREAGNTPALNDDPIPLVSPNDMLCPLVTYLLLGWYAAFRPPVESARWERARVLFALLSFVIKVVTI